jgi:hypothetical protein
MPQLNFRGGKNIGFDGNSRQETSLRCRRELATSKTSQKRIDLTWGGPMAAMGYGA